jgi:TusA-related sulfurtransferase
MPVRTLDLATAEEECGDSALGRVRRELAALEAGELLEVLTGVTEQVFAVRAWARRAGAAVVEEGREGGRTRLVLRAAGAAPAPGAETTPSPDPEPVPRR